MKDYKVFSVAGKVIEFAAEEMAFVPSTGVIYFKIKGAVVAGFMSAQIIGFVESEHVVGS
jgi:hypothetical protein